MLMSIVGFFWYIILTIIEPQTKNLGFFLEEVKTIFIQIMNWMDFSFQFSNIQKFGNIKDQGNNRPGN